MALLLDEFVGCMKLCNSSQTASNNHLPPTRSNASGSGTVKQKGAQVRFLHFLAIAIAVFAINAEAQWYDPNTGKPVPDNEWRKKSGDFGAMLVVTGNVKKFLDEWYGTKETHIPRLDPVSKI